MEEERAKVPLWRLFLLSASAGALDLGYAVEGAYIIPFMVASGLSLTLSTVLITLSPIMGMLFQGFIGAVSDKCTCSWGRRRPFIVLFSLTAVLGFGPLPYCYYIDTFFLKLIVIVVCVFLLDFSCGLLMLPTRAYLLDVVPVSQSKTGNFIISVAVGVGAALGFGLGAVDWSVVVGTSISIEHQSQIVFGLTSVVFIVAMICTILSVKEQNPSILEAHIKSTATSVPEEETTFDEKRSEDAESLEKQPLVSDKPKNKCLPGSDKICKTFAESTIGVLKFAYYMSYDIWFVWLMSAFAFASDFSFVYGFTTFVGLAVYEGDSSSPEGSESYDLYTKGVRMGSLGLAIATVCCSVMSLVLDYITRWIRLKTVLLITIATFVCSLCLLMYCRELYQVYILAAMYGPFFGTILTVPYAIIPMYQVSEVYNAAIARNFCGPNFFVNCHFVNFIFANS